MEALEKLRAAFPPPGGIPPADWDAVEADLGLRLPSSYKRLCDLYGDSKIDDVRLFAPQAADKDNRFPKAALLESRSMREERDDQDDSYPSIPDYRGWRFHPEENGLLPWALETQAVCFLVDPDADPDSWRIVAHGDWVGDAYTSNLRVAEETDAAAFLVRLLEIEPGASARPPRPPGGVEETWERIEAVLEARYPEAFAALRPGADDDAVFDLEVALSARLPLDYRDFLLRHDGQEPDGPWLVAGGQLNSLGYLHHDWSEWTAMQESGELDEYVAEARPDPGVRADQWWRRGWLPFVSQDGDHLVLDLDPAPGGQFGQVFAFSHETGPGRLAAASFTEWMRIWAEELEAGVVEPVESPIDDEDEDDEDDDYVEDDDDQEIESTRTWPF